MSLGLELAAAHLLGHVTLNARSFGLLGPKSCGALNGIELLVIIVLVAAVEELLVDLRLLHWRVLIGATALFVAWVYNLAEVSLSPDLLAHVIDLLRCLVLAVLGQLVQAASWSAQYLLLVLLLVL